MDRSFVPRTLATSAVNILSKEDPHGEPRRPRADAASLDRAGVPTVLIVDDEVHMRRVLRVLIEDSGTGLVVVGEAATGEEACEQWSRLRPHLVLLDQRLPDMLGFEVAKRIFAQQPDQGIILLSGYLDPPTEQRAKALGIRAALSKSNLTEVVAALTRCLV
jgi:two-component system, NarL family, invasion response regulator UvrY